MAQREYKLDDLIVRWDSDLCEHCHKCADSLPEVFDPQRRPWVKLELGTPDAIRRVVNECPSGAISMGN